MAETLYTRSVSGFPLSISTAFAFESLFPPRQSVYDSERPSPGMINFTIYSQLWINVETLFRNMIQAADKEAVMNTGYKETSAVLIDELDTIESLLQNEGKGIMTPVFYVCNYKNALRNLHKGLSLRQDKTAKQIHYADLLERTLNHLKKERTDIRFYPGELRNSTPNTSLILTHIPYDLLSSKYFTRLDLLESNTGKLKRKHQWNSKYYPIPNKNMGILPFNRFLLMTLGDKPMVQPAPIKLRTSIIECAEKRKWTPATTKDKCLLDLSLDLHPFDFVVIKSASTLI